MKSRQMLEHVHDFLFIFINVVKDSTIWSTGWNFYAKSYKFLILKQKITKIFLKHIKMIYEFLSFWSNGKIQKKHNICNNFQFSTRWKIHGNNSVKIVKKKKKRNSLVQKKLLNSLNLNQWTFTDSQWLFTDGSSYKSFTENQCNSTDESVK